MKMHLLKILSIITICFLCLSGQAQTCPGSLGTTVNIASLPYTGTALTTCGAGNEITESNATICGSSSYYGGEDLVFIFTPTTTGDITISLTSSSSWIGMMLYNGCPFTGQGGSCVGNIQNSSGSKTLTVTVTSGVTYYLLVDTWPSPTCIPSFNLSIPSPAGNDPCLSITTLSCGMAVSATPSGAGLWNVTTCGFSTPGQDKIYSFTPTTTGSHSLQVNSLSGGYIDYFFKAASGGCNSSGWTCIDDINFTGTYPIGTLTAGVQYYFLLDPEGTGSYNHNFQIVCPAPVVDPCLSITPLACATPATVTLSGTGVWNSSTCFFSTPGQEKIYSFTPTVTGVHNIQVTSASGTGYMDYQYKAASGGCSATGWTCIDDINFTGTFSIGMLTAGVQYYILLDAESMTSSSQTFQINCPVAFDPCSSIFSIMCGTTATVTLSGTGVWNSSTCLFSTPGQEKIFSFTPTTTGAHSIQVTSASGTGYMDYQYKAASGGCSATGWTCIDDINFTGTFSIGMLTAGVQYYILLDAESTSSSTQTFQIVGASLNTYYFDMDGDGFGDSANTTMACSVPTGYVTNNTDCNDNNNAINPAATEICDGIDNDCDGSTDEGVLTTYYRDMDGDTFGDPANTTTACSQPTGYVTNNSDCDDNDPLEKPGQVWYADTDNDGYGEIGTASITQCLRPAGYRAAVELTSTTGDCNDTNNAINPGATEVCDGIDNDCDGLTDEGEETTWYRDMDGDTYGDPANTTTACSQPTGYVTNNSDCDDNDPLEKPGQVWYADTDNDGYGEIGTASITQCLRPAGYRAAVELTSTTGDCNDTNNAINPGATEVCDDIDNDCDGLTDEGVQTTYYRDMDGDTFGDPANTTMACSQPVGYVANNTDCDDNDAIEKPGQVWYADTDNDGYGETGAPTVTQCLRPVGYKAAIELTSTTGDCNDTNNAINPGATEVCDDIDNDCDGLTDEGVQTTYYRDMDGDTFGDPANTTMACSPPTGYVANNTDCDDNDPLEKPGQVWYADTDNDGYGQTGAPTVTQCLRPLGYKAAIELTSTTGDCNDTNNAINPGATEVCDGIDNDCDGLTDEGVLTTYYRDMDGDTFGDPANTTMACSPPTGYVANNTDCDDNDPLEKPGQVWYADSDNDGYGETGALTVTQCHRPLGYKAAIELTSTTSDCNDTNNTINPGATEVCDMIDNNCNGSIDEIFILPCGWNAETNGVNCSNGNNVSYNPNTQIFTATSTNCYYPNSFTSDALAFAQYDLCGNGSVTAQVTSITGGLGWAGVTMRENNATGAKKAQLMTNLSSFSRREFRTTTGAAAYPQQFPSQNRYWLRITRTGNQFAMYISQNGTSWSLSGMQTIVMGNCIEVGLVVTNYTANSTVTATFGNVSVTGGAPLRPAIQTGEDVFAAADFTILPNPSNGWIEIDLRSYVQRKVQMELYNLQGKLLRSTKIETGRGKEEIDLTSFANGMYLVRVRAEGLPDVTKRVVLNSNY